MIRYGEHLHLKIGDTFLCPRCGKKEAITESFEEMEANYLRANPKHTDLEGSVLVCDECAITLQPQSGRIH